MATVGTIWPNTPEHPPLWWLAAEIIAESYAGEEMIPEDIDPRVYFAGACPRTHEQWMKRIAEYAKRGIFPTRRHRGRLTLPDGQALALLDCRRCARGLESTTVNLPELLTRIGCRVRFHRIARDMSLPALAIASGLSKGHLSEIEHGKKNVSVETLHKLAKALGVRISHLLP